MVLIDAGRCTGCNLCVFSCPERALSCYGLARLDPKRCTGCLACLGFCPMGAIIGKTEGG
ncbi:MAG: 4Fe-4S binding protein [Proteobacteria bacterium]|nr:4Fe-4S binding protein [Pseudomonadota bacterium]